MPLSATPGRQMAQTALSTQSTGTVNLSYVNACAGRLMEAMGTAYALYTLTGDSQYEEWYQKWWDYCIKYLMDYENGSRWQELDADNKVTTKVWDGKQDIYHLLHCWSFLVCHSRRAWLQRSRRVSPISTRNRS